MVVDSVFAVVKFKTIHLVICTLRMISALRRTILFVSFTLNSYEPIWLDKVGARLILLPALEMKSGRGVDNSYS